MSSAPARHGETGGIQGRELVGRSRESPNSTSKVSCSKSNPFAVSEDGDEFELEDFSYIMPRPRDTMDFPSGLLELRSRGLESGFDSRLGRSLTDASRRPVSDYERATSEWETVHGDEDVDQEVFIYSAKIGRRSKTYEVVPGLRPFGLLTSPSSRLALPRRNTILGPPDISLPRLPNSVIEKWVERRHSFTSSSSFYSDGDEEDWAEEELMLRLNANNPPPPRYEAGPLVNNAFDRLRRDDKVASWSKTSSSASADRFKYDAGAYSAFLQPSAERDISLALHHLGSSGHSRDFRAEPSSFNVDDEVKIPVGKHEEPKKDIVTRDQAPFANLGTGLAALVAEGKHDTGGDGDWQTVTTDFANDFGDASRSNSTKVPKGVLVNNGGGFPEHTLFGREPVFSPPRMMQHPVQHQSGDTYHVRYDKQTGRPLLLPRLRAPGALGFPQNTGRAMVAGPQRATAALHNLGASIRNGHSTSQRSPAVGTLTMARSYVSLGSDSDEEDRFGAKEAKSKGDKVKGLPTELDILRPAGLDQGTHDAYQLPFPLISLTEAATTQYFRRTRGEEDHTGPIGSFASRARTRTISSVSSAGNSPRVPTSGRFTLPRKSEDPIIARPALVYPDGRNSRLSNRVSTGNDSSDMRRSSSAFLRMQVDDTPPHLGYSWDNTARCGSPSLLSPRFLRIRGFKPGKTRNQSGRVRQFGQRSLFSPSEHDLIELAREDILFRRRYAFVAVKRQRAIFITIVTLSVLFPLVGLLALCHLFDSTISWYTQGELHCLTTKQRCALKWQLAVELVLYPIMITLMAVYFST